MFCLSPLGAIDMNQGDKSIQINDKDNNAQINDNNTNFKDLNDTVIADDDSTHDKMIRKSKAIIRLMIKKQ